MRHWWAALVGALALALGVAASAAPARADVTNGSFQITLSGQIASSAPQGNGTLAVTQQLAANSGQRPALVLQFTLTEQPGGAIAGTVQALDATAVTPIFDATVRGTLSTQGVAHYTLSNAHAATGTGGAFRMSGVWRQSKQGAIAANGTGTLLFPSGFPAAIANAVWPGAAPASAPADPTLWYVTRGAALAAYCLLALTTALGMGISTQAFDSVVARWRVLDLHQILTLTMVALVALHLVTLTLDPFLPFSGVNLLWPGGEPYLPVPVGLGVVALYALAAVTVSSWARRWLRYGVWRAIHYLSLVAFALLTLHGLFSGTDSATPWMTAVYVSAVLLVVALLAFRIIQTVTRRRPASLTAR